MSNRRGKSIYQLSGKLNAMASILSDMRVIDAPTLASLSRYTGINDKSLKSAGKANRISIKLENMLSKSCGFDPSHKSWCDTAVAENVREGDPQYGEEGEPLTYIGADSAVAFEEYLRGCKTSTSQGVSFSQTHLTILQEHLPTHAVSGSAQFNDSSEPLPLFLEVDATKGYTDEGIQFGFQHLRVNIYGLESGSALLNMASINNQEIELGNSKITQKGTQLSPYWEISTKSDKDILFGRYVTEESPLAWIELTSDFASISTKLSTNIYSSLLFEGDGLSKNQEHIMKEILAKEWAHGNSRGGWLSLSSHDLIFRKAEKC